MIRFEQLDTLRFVFAAIVVVGHAIGFGRSIPAGGHAVDFFFLLSGFVLQHFLVHRPVGPGRFLVLRIARMWPLHMLTFLIVLGVYLFYYGQPQQLDVGPTAGIFLQTFLLQNAGFSDRLAYNWPAWSISAELIVNVAILYFVGIRRLYGLAFGLSLALYLYIFHTFGDFSHLHVQEVYFTSGGLVRCTAGILMGCGVYAVWQYMSEHVQRRPVAVTLLTIAEIASILLTVYLLYSQSPGDRLVLVLVMPVFILVFALGHGLLARLLSIRALAYLGNLSYGIYLLHGPLLRAGWVGEWLPRPEAAPFYLGFAVLGAVCLLSVPIYHFFELPCKRLIAGQKRSKTVPQEQVEASAS